MPKEGAFDRRAAVGTMVNDCPGSYWPLRGRTAGIPGACRCETARIWPLLARTATTEAEYPRPASARCAACCTPSLMVVLTGVPGWPCHRFSTLTWLPAAFCTTTSVVGVPASEAWYACSRPDNPTVVPGRYGAPVWTSTLAASVPTLPVMADAALRNSLLLTHLCVRSGTLPSAALSRSNLRGGNWTSSRKESGGAAVIWATI